jgi:hypothetical protein
MNINTLIDRFTSAVAEAVRAELAEAMRRSLYTEINPPPVMSEAEYGAVHF